MKNLKKLISIASIPLLLASCGVEEEPLDEKQNAIEELIEERMSGEESGADGESDAVREPETVIIIAEDQKEVVEHDDDPDFVEEMIEGVDEGSADRQYRYRGRGV